MTSVLAAIPVPIRWTDTGIVILDQRRLPTAVVYETLQTIEDTVDAIVKLKVRGAPLIGLTAAFGLTQYAERLTTTDVNVWRSEVAQAADVL
ncbi:MAG: S-methyl-5-thioribose-1-phosphate isomerase, partial [Bacilli bacterium]